MKTIFAIFSTALSATLLSSAVFAASAPISPASPRSTAAGFEAHLTSGGIHTDVGPFALALGQNGGVYDSSAALAGENQIVPILPLNPTPSLFVNIADMKAHVYSTGIQLDSETTEGDAAANAIAVALNLNPLPPGVVHPQPFLQITANSVKAKASLGIVFPAATTAIATADIHGLTIFGSALGFSAVHYTGSAPPDTIVYDTPTVTITLNKRMEAGIISCSPGCTFRVTSLETVAVDIDLHKAVWNGKKVSGEIAIARASAE